MGIEGKYFISPEEAVKEITGLLTHEDWSALAEYYDLQGSGIKKEELLSGRFFVRTEPPPAAHPGGFWRYRHPFSPGFSFAYYTTGENNIITVFLEIEIDQGGGMIQRGMQSFRMRKYDQGYKILPE